MTKAEFIEDTKHRIINAGLHIGEGSVYIDPNADYVYVCSFEYGKGGMWSSPLAEATWNEGRTFYTHLIR